MQISVFCKDGKERYSLSKQELRLVGDVKGIKEKKIWKVKMLRAPLERVGRELSGE